MQRVQTLALVTSAVVASVLLPASAVAFGPESLREDTAASVQPGRVRVAQAGRGQMGGGFIEAVFGGGSGEYRVQQGPVYGRQYRDYAPAQPQYEIESVQPSRRSPYYVRQMPDAYGTQPDYGQQGYERHGYGTSGRPAMNPRYLKQVVAYDGKERAGTIVIDTPNKFLYLVQDGGRAVRYGIGVGRPGFTWAGVKSVSMKKEWPDWRPPAEMLKRRPDLPTFMAGGPDNPLGARALYLGSSLYRIHGSNEPWTIGTAVSSGCIRMRNEDVIDLYGRVNVGTRVIVI